MVNYKVSERQTERKAAEKREHLVIQEIQLNCSFLHSWPQRSHKKVTYLGVRHENRVATIKSRRGAIKKQIQQEACSTARQESLPSVWRHCLGNRASTHHQRKQTTASKLNGKPRNVRNEGKPHKCDSASTEVMGKAALPWARQSQ